MKLRSALLAATVLAAPVAAKAEAISGLYVAGGAGANFLMDRDLNSVSIAGTTFNLGKTKLQFDTGFRGVGSVGYGLGNGLRVEVEGDYFSNKVSKIGRTTSGSVFSNSFVSAPGINTGGSEYKYGGFVNVLYDFDPNVLGLSFIPFPVTPYVGLGAGYLRSENKDFRIYAQDRSFFLRSNNSDGSFAYQAIVGAAFPVGPSVPGLSITAEYRFTGTAESNSYKAQFFSPGVATGARLKEDNDYNHSLMLGVRYAFNAAPPPVIGAPPPTPGTIPARTYLVFFDWDRADLTDRARQIIAEAAQATTRVQVTRIEVSGHADRSGTPRYNQGLSLRRANNVAAELVRLGVPRNAIGIQAFGDTRPLVPTAAGVREPQNRRVEIVLR